MQQCIGATRPRAGLGTPVTLRPSVSVQVACGHGTPLCHPCRSGAVPTLCLGGFVTSLGWLPGSVRTNAGKGVGVQTRAEVDPRSGLGLDANPVRRRIGAPGAAIGVGVWPCSPMFFHGQIRAPCGGDLLDGQLRGEGVSGGGDVTGTVCDGGDTLQQSGVAFGDELTWCRRRRSRTARPTSC
jgi:hypothetical protein